MNAPVFRRTLLCTCWLPILGTLVAVSFQAFRIAGKPPEYFALGKIMAGQQLTDGKPRTSSAGFYETQIEMLESSLIRKNASERVHGLYPELKEADVALIASQTGGSSILKILATGPDRKYTRAYLDAVLDEYMALRKEMWYREIKEKTAKVMDEVLIRERKMKETKMQVDAFIAANNGAELLNAEKLRLSQLVSKLRGELQADTAPGRPPDSGTAIGVDAIQVRLKQAESGLRDTNEKSVEGESLQEAYDRARHDYEEWKMKLDLINSGGCGEPIAIVERPEDATEIEPDLWTPLVVAAAMGFMGGSVLMLGMSLLAAFTVSTRSSQPPPLA